MRRVLGVLAGSAVVLGSLCGDDASTWNRGFGFREEDAGRRRKNKSGGGLPLLG